MNKNLNRFDRGARIFAGAVLLFLSFAVFDHPVARLLVILSGLWLLLEGICGCCPLYEMLGVKRPGQMKPETLLQLMIAGMQVVIGYVWWHAGWVKIWAGDFIPTLPAKLAMYASANPYPFVRNFLLNQATHYSNLFGGLIQFSQYLIGIALVALAYVWVTASTEAVRRGALYLSVVGFALGAFMNAVFYFALGHVDPWAAAGNVVMFWGQLILIYGFINLVMIKGWKK